MKNDHPVTHQAAAFHHLTDEVTAREGRFLEAATGDASIALRGRVQPLGNAALVRKDPIVRTRHEPTLTIVSAVAVPNDGVSRPSSPAPSAWCATTSSLQTAGANQARRAADENG